MKSHSVKVPMIGTVFLSEKPYHEQELTLVFQINKPDEPIASKYPTEWPLSLCVGFDVHLGEVAHVLSSGRLRVDQAARVIDAAELLLQLAAPVYVAERGYVSRGVTAEYGIGGADDFIWRKVDGQWTAFWLDGDQNEQILTDEDVTEMLAETVEFGKRKNHLWVVPNTGAHVAPDQPSPES